MNEVFTYTSTGFTVESLDSCVAGSTKQNKQNKGKNPKINDGSVS